jgi:DNA sulfur modification protein DndD
LAVNALLRRPRSNVDHGAAELAISYWTQIGTLIRDWGFIDEETVALEQEKRVVERRAHRVHERLAGASGFDERSRMALKAARVLEEFAHMSERSKLADIELETARLYNRLSRKGAFLSGVAIDPERFTVSLTRWDGSTLPKERLSAGEKQLFAISVLWALAKTSRRAVPVIVDTPLARLDSEHRGRLLTEYFPHVSHQVIVLSTDTEVDVHAASMLEPYVSRRIELDHDPVTAKTTVVDGYFSAEGARNRARA